MMGCLSSLLREAMEKSLLYPQLLKQLRQWNVKRENAIFRFSLDHRGDLASCEGLCYSYGQVSIKINRKSESFLIEKEIIKIISE